MQIPTKTGDVSLEVTRVESLGNREYAVWYTTEADDGNPTKYDGDIEGTITVPRGETIEDYLDKWFISQRKQRAVLNQKALKRRDSIKHKKPGRMKSGKNKTALTEKLNKRHKIR